jgi:hypothetical protein
VDSVKPHNFLDYLSNGANTDPVALAEVGIPGVAPVTTPATIPLQCYSNLLAVDGHPVDIEISGSTTTALANGGLTIRGCGNAAQGITLGPGTHTLTTASYQSTGLDVDALNLGSSAGGAAEPLTTAGLLAAPPAHSSPGVRVLHQGRTSLTVKVAGDGTPFWMVLGQSQSNGWKATTSSGVHLSSSTLIDGYANGWYVPGSVARGPTTITLTWTPQRVVNVAILVSAATLLVSVVLIAVPSTALGPLRRRRRHGRHRRGGRFGRGGQGRRGAHAGTVGSSTAAGSSAATTATPAAGAVPSLGGDPVRPELTSLLRTGGAAPSWPKALGIAVVVGLAAALFVAPLAGVLVGAVVLLELLVDRSRIAVVAGTLGLLVVTAGYVTLHQHRNGFVPDINWPAHMGLANSLVWVAVFLLSADGVVAWVRHRRGPPR